MKAKKTVHPPVEALAAHAEGEPLAPELRVHLAACAACREELEGLRSLIGAMRRDRVPDPDPGLVAAVERLAERTPGGASGETRARLVDTVAESEALAGTRGVPPRAALRFAVAGLKVDVEVSGAAGRVRILGQALTGAEPPAVVWAERDGRTLAEAPVGDHGEFALEDLAARPEALVLVTGAGRVRLVLPPEPER